MGLIESANQEVKGLRGLHLYHFFMSNCSQRARLALEEKGLEWTSHHVDLATNEHASDWYQSIHPHGLVPTLVHDGRVIIESNDILQYLDAQFPEPPLTPADPGAAARMRELMEVASAIQPANKVLSHDRLFRRFRKLSVEELEKFARQHRNAELVAFMRDFWQEGEAWRARIAQAERNIEQVLERLEGVLEKTAWLSGERLGLADLSWSVNVHRLVQLEYELANRPQILDWYQRLAKRPSFERAVASYRPG